MSTMMIIEYTNLRDLASHIFTYLCNNTWIVYYVIYVMHVICVQPTGRVEIPRKYMYTERIQYLLSSFTSFLFGAIWICAGRSAWFSRCYVHCNTTKSCIACIRFGRNGVTITLFTDVHIKLIWHSTLISTVP